MNRQRQFATWSGAVLGMICALFLLSLAARASDHQGAFTEEFHQTYALTPDGRETMRSFIEKRAGVKFDRPCLGFRASFPGGSTRIRTWDLPVMSR